MIKKHVSRSQLLVEGEERFLVTLSASDDFDSRITLSPTTAEVIINDDDCE